MMAGNKVLFDTNVLIRFLNGDHTLLPIIDGSEKYISFLTEIELFCKPSLAGDERAAIVELVSACTVLPYNDGMKELIVALRTQHRLKMPDAFIAASAIQAQLPLFTFDKGFQNVRHLELFTFPQ